MLETLIQQVVQQIPSLAVLVALVVMFMRYMRSRDEQMADISNRCHTVQDRSITAIDKNTEVIGACIERLRQMNGEKR
jgi:hypothetical protein